jgi:rubrerythrin
MQVLKEAGNMAQAEGQRMGSSLQKALAAARQSKQSYEQLAQETSVSATKQIFHDMASDMQRHIDQLDYRMQTVAQAEQFDRSN